MLFRSLAGPGVPGLDVLRAQTRAIAVEAGAGERDLEAHDRLLEGIHELAASGLEGEERDKRITELVEGRRVRRVRVQVPADADDPGEGVDGDD